MATLINLFNSIVNGETATKLINDKKESEIGHIGEAILRMAVALCIDPRNTYHNVTGIVYSPKSTRFDDISLEHYLNNSKIVNSCETGTIDVAWISNNQYVVCSSKFGKNVIPNLDCIQVRELYSEIGIGKVTHNGALINNESIVCYVLVRNKAQLQDMLKKKRQHVIRTILNPENVLDINDLDRICFKIQEMTAGIENPIKRFINPKKNISLRFHQELIVRNANVALLIYNTILIGALPRSGKTYIGAKLCEGYSRILVLTTRPSETRNSWIDIFSKSFEFENYVIRNMDSAIECDVIEDNTIIISSTQFFKHGDRRSKKDAIFDIILIDEIHDGGCTTKSEEIMTSKSNSYTKFILMTATYEKPIAKFGLQKENCFFWDLEDVRLMKNWSPESVSRLCEKYGNSVLDIVREFEIKKRNIAGDYVKFPEPYMITTSMHQKYYTKLMTLMNNPTNIFGFSMRTLLMTTKDDSAFQNPKAVDMFLRLISGSNVEEDYPEGDMSIITRIQRIQQMNDHIRDKDFLTMQWFLPFGVGQKLDGVKKALIRHIQMNYVFSEFMTMTLDSGDHGISKHVSDNVSEAKRSGKKGLIILTGDVGSLGVSIPEVDATFLMHDFESSDKTFQQLTRCLTEDYENGKRVGVIVDFNVWRVLNTVSTYAIGRCGKTFKDTTEKVTWCISNLMRIDSDLWECPDIETLVSKQSVIEELTTQWTKMMESAGYSLTALEREIADIGSDQAELNSLFKYSASSRSTKEKKDKMQDGLSVRSDESDKESVETKEIEIETKIKNINLNELLARLIPEIALLSGGKMNLEDAMEYIGNDPVLHSAMNEFLKNFT